MSKSLVFITGATGFIGSQVVASTLKSGYRVRLSIRKKEQAISILKRYGDSDIETCLIPDLSKPEAFSTALADVDYVFHLASPMPGSGINVKSDYIEPAVQATTSILLAALKFKQIKKVFVMSSLFALTPVDAMISPSVIAKENTGEIIPLDLSMSFPDGLPGQVMMYAASKIAAHQATRDFLAANSPHYTLVTFHPTYVLGDSLIQEKASDIDSINGLLWLSIKSGKPMLGNSWVHVRDVASAYVKALEVEIKSGMEFILSSPVFSWEDVASYIKTKYPALDCQLQGPFEGRFTVETTAAESILGLKWRSEKEIIDDVLNQQLSLQAADSAN